MRSRRQKGKDVFLGQSVLVARGSLSWALRARKVGTFAVGRVHLSLCCDVQIIKQSKSERTKHQKVNVASEFDLG